MSIIPEIRGPRDPFLLRRGVADIIVEHELIERLESGEQLRLKQGFDPTRPDLTLGHAVGLRKLRQFQALGHRVILIVGDWTAQIGDPSGRSEGRTMLTAEEVHANAQTYLEQFFRVVDRELTDVVFQSEWFGRFGLADVLQLTARFTVAQMLEREDFAQRMERHNPIGVVELLYPLLQAYDSVAIRADVEFGGTDQRFNILTGRELQRMVGQRPQQAFLVKILVGLDGHQKMSKSLGNYIALTTPPYDMYGKIMSLPDAAMADYFECLTNVPDAELAEMLGAIARGEVNPMLVKKRLAREIVSVFYDEAAAATAEEEWTRVFQRREPPTEEPVCAIPSSVERMPAVDLLVHCKLAASKSDARRVIQQGGFSVNGLRVSDPKAEIELREGTRLQVGALRRCRITRS